MKKISITFIIGYPRSGTTLLGNVLGSIKNSVHVGEVSRVWKRNIKTVFPPRKCGCGQEVEECEMWSVILNDTYQKFEAEFGEELSNDLLADWRDKIIYGKTISDNDFEKYSYFTKCLYTNIVEYFNVTQIIDSSKDLLYADLLESLGIFDITYIHLVRELPGVILSRQKKLKSPRVDGTVKLNYKYVASDSFRWLRNYFQVNNYLHGKNSLKIDYSKFAKDPLQILNENNITGIDKVFNDEHSFKSKNLHTIMGNRNRYVKGDIIISKDNKWQTQLSGFDKKLLKTINNFI